MSLDKKHPRLVFPGQGLPSSTCFSAARSPVCREPPRRAGRRHLRLHVDVRRQQLGLRSREVRQTVALRSRRRRSYRGWKAIVFEA